jgi:hypothetical protein
MKHVKSILMKLLWKKKLWRKDLKKVQFCKQKVVEVENED